MTAKEYLEQIGRLDALITQKTAMYRQLKANYADMSGFSFDKDKVKTSKKAEAPFVSIVERCIELEADITEMENQKTEIIKKIQAITVLKYEIFLYKKFVERKSSKVIAREMDYRYEWIKSIQSAAIEHFEKVYAGELEKTY